MVSTSSFPMHFRILAMLLRLTPMLRLRSHRKWSNPSERSCNHTIHAQRTAEYWGPFKAWQGRQILLGWHSVSVDVRVAYLHMYERDVGRVHGLQGKASAAAVKIGILRPGTETSGKAFEMSKEEVSCSRLNLLPANNVVTSDLETQDMTTTRRTVEN